MITDPAPSGELQPYPDENQVFASLYDSAAFAEFEQAVDQGLEVLVGRWVHLAAPNAARGGIRPMVKAKLSKPSP